LRIGIDTGQHPVLVPLNANLVNSLLAVGTQMNIIGKHQLMVGNKLLPLLIGFQRRQALQYAFVFFIGHPYVFALGVILFYIRILFQ